MWLVESEIRAKIVKAEAEGWMPDAEHQDKLSARFEASMSGAVPDIMSIAGDKAQIDIKGLLTNAPNFMAMLFGGGNTTYPEIIAALGAAESDDSISEIILSIDSPGGSVQGLFDTLNAISKAKKPIRAVVSNIAASAAFAIASQADKIVASNQATMVGSIGIVTEIPVSENVVKIASSDAPKKSPDVTTTAGIKIVQERLDALHEVFAESIAAGRSAATGRAFSINDVNADFGQGGVFLAREALKKGMIDGIEENAAGLSGSFLNMGAVAEGKVSAGASAPVKDFPIKAKIVKIDEKNNNSKREGKIMDLSKLKAEHRDLYDAVVKEGFDAGIAQERDRVTAHLTLGEASGAMKDAVNAVTEGTEINATMQAKYMSASMKKGDIANRSADDAAALAAIEGAEGAEEKDAEDKVADIVAAGFGYKEPSAEGGAV